MSSIDRIPSLDEQIVRCRGEFEGVLARLTKAGTKRTLDETERELFADVLRLGQVLLQAHVSAQGDGHLGPAAKGGDGVLTPFHGHKSIDYRSVFGIIAIRRAYYWAQGRPGFCPLDERLSLPERLDSYLLIEWALRMGVADSYDETCAGLMELLHLALPKAHLETHAAEVGASGRAFYDMKQAPRPLDEGPILVVCADGKGVPMKKEVPAGAPKRLAKGEKRQQKKMAFVGTVYTSEKRRHHDEEPPPTNKEAFAELEHRDRFAQELGDRARRREKGRSRRVFLADGQRDIWEMKDKHFAQYVGVLDWMHASEYLWQAAYLWLPESSPQAHEWVKRQQGRFLKGKVRDVIRELKRLVHDGTIHGTAKQRTAATIIGYFTHNKQRMKYDRYRRWGLPIGSGAVEGACRHLVKDRMERSGMRWTVPGAQAILHLRGIYISDHWDAFWSWFKKTEHNRLYAEPAA